MFRGGTADMGDAHGKQLSVPLNPLIDKMDPVTPSGALQISSVYACIELLANTISTMPIFVYETAEDGSRKDARDSNVWFLLHDSPNAWMTPPEFLSTMVMNRLLRGNAYAQIVRDGNKPHSLIPLSADQMEVERADGRIVYIYREGQNVSVLAPENVIHWKGIGNGYIGMSKLDYMRATVNEAKNAQQNANSLYGAGSKPSGILSVDAALDDKQIADIQRRFAGMARGGSGLYVVDRGLKYSQLSLTPEDAQLLESRNFTVEEICRWFGIPPVLVGAKGASTWGSGIAELTSGFHKYLIGPLCCQFQAALAKRLVGVNEHLQIEFKFDSFLRSSPAERASFYSTMVQNGLMTRNEVRRLENLDRIEGGDDLTIQANLVPAKELGKQPVTTDGVADGSTIKQ